MARDKEKYNTYHREYQKQRARRWKEYAHKKLGGGCVVCGTSEDLEIDHIDWRTKSNKYGNLWSIAKDKSEAELLKCQLLCSTHHKEKTVQDRLEQAQAKRDGTYERNF